MRFTQTGNLKKHILGVHKITPILLNNTESKQKISRYPTKFKFTLDDVREQKQEVPDNRNTKYKDVSIQLQSFAEYFKPDQ